VKVPVSKVRELVRRRRQREPEASGVVKRGGLAWISVRLLVRFKVQDDEEPGDFKKDGIESSGRPHELSVSCRRNGRLFQEGLTRSTV